MPNTAENIKNSLASPKPQGEESLFSHQGGPTALIIFGATGDLARKRIFPALFELFKNGLLPQKFKIIACARTQFTNIVFRKVLSQNLQIKNTKVWQEFCQKIDYLPLDVDKDINLHQLAQDIDEFEKAAGACLQRIYYMAISPDIFEPSIENFAKNNLHLGCQKHEQSDKQLRIIVEKPFGHDFKSARRLNTKLLKYFKETQIYRIDHYLGKETVQNIFAFRFANELFEPVWNNQYIDHVQITQAEYRGVEKRGEFYDKTGALRDILQNHCLQLLAITSMEEPSKFEAKSIIQKKLEVLKSIKILSSQETIANTVRGQYEGYLNEEKILPNSTTDTYALVKLEVASSRWQGVPFYIRTGKKLEGTVTSIIIQFKEKGRKLFGNFWDKPLPNRITLQIQPNEGIGIRLSAKKPGLSTQLEPVDMEFCYKTSFDTPQPDAYERLLIDIILADQSLFLTQEIVEESWKIIDPIREMWDSGKPKLETYKAGGWGPQAADRLIEKDGRQWLAPLLTICKI